MAKRLRLRFEGAIDLGGNELNRRTLIAVPPSLTFISDLTHHLHRRFGLPLLSIILSLDGYVLLPASRLNDILRDGELLDVCVSSYTCDSQVRERKVARKLALADGTLHDLDVSAAGNSLQPTFATASQQLSIEAAPPSVTLESIGNGRCGEVAGKLLALADARPTKGSISTGASGSSSSSEDKEQESQSSLAPADTCAEGDTARGSAARKARPALATRCHAGISRPPSRAEMDALATIHSDDELLQAYMQGVVEIPQEEGQSAAGTEAAKLQAAWCGMMKLRALMKEQVEFYMGDENYPRDRWLRSQANRYDGWLPMKLVAGFNRVRDIGGALGLDFRMKFIADCLKGSTVVEVAECGEWIKRTQPDDEHQ